MARSEVELKRMMKKFKRYIDKKELTLSAGKSKIMVFEKGRGRTKRREWKWGEEEIEEVKEMNYLSYIIKNGGAEKYIIERMRRAMGGDEADLEHRRKDIRGQLRKKNKDVNALVGSVALYGAEI